MSIPAPSAATPASPSGWGRFSQTAATGFRRYAEWLVGISWKMFFLLSILALIAAGILSDLPPFSWELKRTVEQTETKEPSAKRSARTQKLKERVEKRIGDIEIKIDESGVRIQRKRGSADAQTTPKPATLPDGADAPNAPKAPATPVEPPAQPVAPAAPTPGAPASSGGRVDIGPTGISISLAPGKLNESVQEVVQEVRENIREEVRDSIREAIDEELARAEDKPKAKVRVIRLGSFLPQLALLLIVTSMVIKIVYAGRVKAEVKAAVAEETAEAESLKRQVVEARMAAMQAQVEPHFLFNTLASIDHLIEVDPSRASRMQKNLISLLRASMPALRDSETNLGRELAVVRPYLEILKVRMEDRLQTEVNVSEGLHSADFPPMMLQSLVENAIKHGLEPKPEGGRLTLDAEVVHGKLAVTVADTGVGFGRAATAGTGIGLSNIRERLKLIYGDQAELRIAENAPAGTRITIVVPYRACGGTNRS
jgi:hypothetical protein